VGKPGLILSNNPSKQSKQIIEATIAPGHSLDLNVVAERVEHVEQPAMLETLSVARRASNDIKALIADGALVV